MSREPSEEASTYPLAHQALADLVTLLDLDRTGPDRFLGSAPKDRWQRVFGGQVLGQALMAANRTVQGRSCHSLHAYFLRPGDPKTPISYDVERSRDGGSFSARRVVAIQGDRILFTMAASFQAPETGFEHQADMPEAPPPESLPDERTLRLEIESDLPLHMHTWRERPIEIRPVEPRNRFHRQPHDPRQIVWIRTIGPLPEDPAWHGPVLAYASDMTLLDTSLLAHGMNVFIPQMQLASIDHAMWFHRPFRADEWLLYVQDSPSASGGRGFSRGQIFQRDGRLVASVAQEGLIRNRG